MRAVSTIKVRDDLSSVVREAEQALICSPDVEIYVRAHQLVRVVGRSNDDRDTAAGTLRGTAPTITPIPTASLRELIDRVANWTKLDRNGDLVSALPPTWVAETLAARGSWDFPPLSGVVESPTMRPDGSILSKPGYDRASGLLYEPIGNFPGLPEVPERNDAVRALRQLLEPLGDFPFVSDADVSVALAAILSIVGRRAIDGCVPLFVLGAPSPGTGKSLLGEVIGLIGTGRSPAKMPPPSSDEEARKRILAVAMGGYPLVFIDNVVGSLGTASMAAAITSVRWTDRCLGRSAMVTLPLHAVWLASGNNLGFRDDLGRRVLPLLMDAGLEDPESRGNFKYSNLCNHVSHNRAALFIDALTVLRAYHLAGRPAHGKPPLGSFEAWDALVRGAIIWAGFADPCDVRRRVQDEADADVEMIRSVLGAWNEAFGETAKTTGEAIKEAVRNTRLREALAGVGRRGSEGKLSGRVIGSFLRRSQGRIVMGLRLEGVGIDHGAKLWRVVSR